MMTKRDAEVVLGLSSPYTKDDLRKAFRTGVKKWHPDRATAQGIDQATASEMYSKVTEAEKYLSDFFKDKPADYKQEPSPATDSTSSTASATGSNAASTPPNSSPTNSSSGPTGNQSSSQRRADARDAGTTQQQRPRQRRSTTNNDNPPPYDFRQQSQTNYGSSYNTNYSGYQGYSGSSSSYARDEPDAFQPSTTSSTASAPSQESSDPFRNAADVAQRIRNVFLGVMVALFLVAAQGAANLVDFDSQSPLVIAKIVSTPLWFLIPGLIEWRYELIRKLVCGTFSKMADGLADNRPWAKGIVFILKAFIAVFRFLLLLVGFLLDIIFNH